MIELKSKITKIRQRDTLSITPKVEDLQVVYRWIQKYNVPHFYVQVFFDRIYGISFEEILDLLGKESMILYWNEEPPVLYWSLVSNAHGGLFMTYNYNPLWKLLIDKGLTKTDMRKKQI